MGGFFGVEDQLNGMVETRDTQHRALRNRDPANQLRFPLVFDLIGPAKLGHLKPQGIDLAFALVGVGIRPKLEAIQRLLHLARHAPIQSVNAAVPRERRDRCAGRGGGCIA